MKFTIFAAATLAAVTATSAVAATSAVRTVEADGRTISYVVDTRPDGTYVLTSAPREPSEFRLLVKGGRVYGHVEGRSVNFAAPQVKPARAIAD